MAINVMTLVWDSDVQAPERFTLLALADRADEDGKCWPSVRWLSRKCQTSERTIRRHLSWLESESLIRRTVRLNDSSVYRVQLRALAKRKLPDPCQSDTPGQSDTPEEVAGGVNLTGGSSWPGVTDGAREGCQSDPQYVIEPSLTTSRTSSSGTAALAPDPSPDTVPARPAVEALCCHLRDRLVANGSLASVSKAWRDSARLLLDKDGRDESEAHRLIDWCQSHSFWMTNIHSMPTFRKQYDKLRLQASQGRHLTAVTDRRHRPYQNPTDESVWDAPL